MQNNEVLAGEVNTEGTAPTVPKKQGKKNNLKKKGKKEDTV